MASRPLTTPDLVVLSLLDERPMHGHEVDRELTRRDVRDWADLSRPQIYYSLRKLEDLGLLAPARGPQDSGGPPRRVLAPTARGRRALAEALDRPEWVTQRVRPAFLTWLALAHTLSRPRIRRLIAQRRAYLEAELAREQQTQTAIHAELGPEPSAPSLMVGLTIRHFQVELEWLGEVAAAYARS